MSHEFLNKLVGGAFQTHKIEFGLVFSHIVPDRAPSERTEEKVENVTE